MCRIETVRPGIVHIMLIRNYEKHSPFIVMVGGAYNYTTAISHAEKADSTQNLRFLINTSKMFAFGSCCWFVLFEELNLKETVTSLFIFKFAVFYLINKNKVFSCLVWCPGQNKRIAPFSFLHGCRKRRLKD
jgi:hypothetical protein